jgi:hypothetical protein
MNTKLMGVDYAERLLDIYIQSIINILDSNFGVDRAENTMFDAIILLKDYRELKPVFLRKVANTFAIRSRDAFDYNTVPEDFIELCAHELRWPEFLELAKDRIKTFFHGDITLAAGDVSNSIRDAYSDEWADREFYRHYMQD